MYVYIELNRLSIQYIRILEGVCPQSFCPCVVGIDTMTDHEPSPPTRSETTTGFDFHRDGDRGCPHCGEVALAFDPVASSARCRACGERA